MRANPKSLFLLVTLVGLSISGCTSNTGLTGDWELDKDRSSDMNPWRGMKLSIAADADTVSIHRAFLAGRYSRYDSMTVIVGSDNDLILEQSAKWLEQPHLGVHIADGAVKKVRADWDEDGRSLKLVSDYPLETSQGQTSVHIETVFQLHKNGRELTVTQNRSSRPAPVVLVFARAESS